MLLSVMNNFYFVSKPMSDQDIILLKKDMDYMKQDIQEIKASLKTFIQKADEKYASKETEKIVKSLIGLIVIAVVTALIALVLK